MNAEERNEVWLIVAFINPYEQLFGRNKLHSIYNKLLFIFLGDSALKSVPWK